MRRPACFIGEWPQTKVMRAEWKAHVAEVAARPESVGKSKQEVTVVAWMEQLEQEKLKGDKAQLPKVMLWEHQAKRKKTETGEESDEGTPETLVEQRKARTALAKRKEQMLGEQTEDNGKDPEPVVLKDGQTLSERAEQLREEVRIRALEEMRQRMTKMRFWSQDDVRKVIEGTKPPVRDGGKASVTIVLEHGLPGPWAGKAVEAEVVEPEEEREAITDGS